MNQTTGIDFVLEATAAELSAIKLYRLFLSLCALENARAKQGADWLHVRDASEHFHVFAETLGFPSELHKADSESGKCPTVELYNRAFPPPSDNRMLESARTMSYNIGPCFDSNFVETENWCRQAAEKLMVNLDDALAAIQAFFEAVEAPRLAPTR